MNLIKKVMLLINFEHLLILKAKVQNLIRLLSPLKPFYLSVSLFTCHHAGTSTQSEQRIKRERRA